MTVDQLELVVITGMSGAGKTVAMQSFEDMGYFCVDNMPPSLLPKFWELVKESGKITKIALVIDLRSRAFFDEIMSCYCRLGITHPLLQRKFLFLEASMMRLFHVTKKQEEHTLLLEKGVFTMVLLRNVVYYKTSRHVRKK